MTSSTRGGACCGNLRRSRSPCPLAARSLRRTLCRSPEVRAASPSLESPAGTEMPGKPARLSGTVNTSLDTSRRDRPSSHRVRTPAHGVIGASSTSQRLNASVKSRAIRLRTLLRPQIVGVVIAGRQHIGADHDAAADFAAEAFGAATLVKIEQIVRALGTVAVAHAVVAREIGRGFRRRHDIIGRERIFSVRQADLDDLGALAPSATRRLWPTAHRSRTVRRRRGTPSGCRRADPSRRHSRPAS